MDAYDDFYVANMPGIQEAREEHEDNKVKNAIIAFEALSESDYEKDDLESDIKSRDTLEKEFNSRDLDTVLMMAENGYALTDPGFELPENFWDKVYKFWKECDQ